VRGDTVEAGGECRGWAAGAERAHGHEQAMLEVRRAEQRHVQEEARRKVSAQDAGTR
jgi:hypothetical protein